jgi:hypothetical protein
MLKQFNILLVKLTTQLDLYEISKTDQQKFIKLLVLRFLEFWVLNCLTDDSSVVIDFSLNGTMDDFDFEIFIEK